ncbi:CFI-box-CTERM domain-containing protein [Acidovorax sp. PRC11]|uniref:CFI-box-CTERM domain-containing protein n=1 Tax=Acidovorax sp. PRC11 TaxID=2962592 RepID=UPI0028834854|nr:CFI-box-CTERM domain-containing protein [Acidovorax sp. PRC11]
MPRRKYAQRDEVSATELAEMGFCEKRVQLAHLYGDQATPEQRQAMARGQVAHQRYLEEGLAATADRRCFVATFVFGPDARETQLLRAYRDAVLLRRRWGRILVAAYYRVAPTGCRIMARSPATVVRVRRILRVVVAWCERALSDRRSP